MSDWESGKLYNEIARLRSERDALLEIKAAAEQVLGAIHGSQNEVIVRQRLTIALLELRKAGGRDG